jgi:hypothetical protein
MNMVQTDIMTLTRFMIENTMENKDQQDLEVLMSSIQVNTHTHTHTQYYGERGILIATKRE